MARNNLTKSLIAFTVLLAGCSTNTDRLPPPPRPIGAPPEPVVQQPSVTPQPMATDTATPPQTATTTSPEQPTRASQTATSSPDTMPGADTVASSSPPQSAQTSATASAVQAGDLPKQASAVIIIGDDMYCLEPSALWKATAAVSAHQSGKPAEFVSCGPAKPQVGAIPIQEFLNFVHSPKRNSLIVLDKSGDIFEWSLADKSWHVFRPNSPIGSPDPEYIDLTVSEGNVCLLDPERNQIWRFPSAGGRYFKDVLPWRVKAGDISVTDGISITDDGCTWVLRRSGKISRYTSGKSNGLAQQIPFRFQPPKDIRPTRIVTASNSPLYVVERENNRVLAIDKQTGATQHFVFPADADLRGLSPQSDGFWIINGNRIEHKLLAQADATAQTVSPRRLDNRLAELNMPLKNAALPRHPGVWPGARRAYRYGVHKGTDFFNDAGAISMDTPVYAAAPGKVVRADGNFKDMTATKYSQVMSACRTQHVSSEENEDLLRGCQVWIDHGNGLLTKYAHLDKTNPALKAGDNVSRGDLVGYVGVSGTGENLAGRSKHPHLHFEVWLDNRYLGWGLTPSETIALFENIFGSRKGNKQTIARNDSKRGGQ